MQITSVNEVKGRGLEIGVRLETVKSSAVEVGIYLHQGTQCWQVTGISGRSGDLKNMGLRITPLKEMQNPPKFGKIEL